MKLILLTAFFIVLATTKIFSQKALYFNVRVGGAFIKNQEASEFGLFNAGNAIPYGMINAGALLGSQFRLGLSVGYLKFQNTDKPAYVPVGVDFFSKLIKNKKVSPLVNLGVYYPFHNAARSFSGTAGGSNDYGSFHSYKGKFMANMGAGLNLTGPGDIGFNITGHFMPLFTTYHYRSADNMGTWSSMDYNITTNIFSVSVDVVLTGKPIQKGKRRNY